MTSTMSASATGSDGDFRAMADSLPHLVWTARDDGSSDYVNLHATTYSGPSESGRGWDWLELVHPGDATRARTAWKLTADRQNPYRADYRIRRVDGAYRWHTFQFQPMHDSYRSTSRWLCTATDIQDAKAVESDLRAAERQSAETLQLLESLQSDAPVGFGFVDRDFRVRHLNATLAAFNGGTVAEQLGKEVAVLAPQVWASRTSASRERKVSSWHDRCQPTRSHSWWPSSIAGMSARSRR